MKTRRQLFKTFFSASVAVTLGAKLSMERVMGAAEGVKTSLTRRVVEVNDVYWCAPFQVGGGSGASVLKAGMAYNGLGAVDPSFLPQRYLTEEDAEAERNPIPPYVFIEVFEDGTPVNPVQKKWWSEEEMEEWEDEQAEKRRQEYERKLWEDGRAFREQEALKEADGLNFEEMDSIV